MYFAIFSTIGLMLSIFYLVILESKGINSTQLSSKTICGSECLSNGSTLKTSNRSLITTRCFESDIVRIPSNPKIYRLLTVSTGGTIVISKNLKVMMLTMLSSLTCEFVYRQAFLNTKSRIRCQSKAGTCFEQNPFRTVKV